MVHPKHPEKDSDSIRQNTNSERIDNTNEDAGKDPAQSHDYKGETQNVNDNTGRPSKNDELTRARNKANEGKDRDVIL